MPSKVSLEQLEEPQSSRAHELTRRRFLLLASGAAIGSAISGCSPDTVSSLPEGGAMGDIHYAPLIEVARMIKAREISPIELTQTMLDRIEAVDGVLKSYATVTSERALSAARKAEQEITSGNYRGPLHGIPIAVKDLCFTQGTRTMGGLAVYRDFIPEYDATVIARLEDAGAVLLGKLNLTEGAMAGYHPDFDIPVNPWDAAYWAGASSSGSGVAVAAGLCFAALGTDTGGSIRFPSMANGTVGLKPTYGRVSRYGVHTLSETLDHVGPMSRATADAAIVLQTIAGHDDNDPTSLREPVPDMLSDLDSGIKGMRIGFDRTYSSAGTDAGLVAAIDEAQSVLKDLGAEIVDVTVPQYTSTVADTWFTICTREALQAHAATFPSRADEYGPYFRNFLEIGASVTDEQYAAANEQRGEYVNQFNTTLQSVDAIVCPSGGLTFPVTPESQYGDATELQPLFEAVQMSFTIPADFAGTPTLTVPCGFTDSGLPYAVQLMGPRLSESLLFRIGHSYESATRWHDRHPAV